MTQVPANIESYITTIYKIHRDFAEHENNLVNHRMTWLITIQSFLIATFGFSFQKYFEVMERLVSDVSKLDKMQNYINAFRIYFVVLSIIGIFSSVFTIRSVRGALLSIEKIGKNWDDRFKNSCEISKLLPRIIGHKSLTLITGHSLANSIPLFFSLLWTSILIMSLLIPPKGMIGSFSLWVTTLTK